LLLDARRAYDEHTEAHPAITGGAEGEAPEDKRRLAFEELLIAEGSDWCWWYGPEHGSENRPEFDQLYRDHLSNVYRALGLAPPDELARPILQDQRGEFRERPANPVHVILDGEVTTPFEWMGAGRYRPDARQGAMHGSGPKVREVFYGSDGSHLFVRLDGASGARFGVEFESGRVAVEVARGRVVEMQAALAGGRFRVVIESEGLAPASVPEEGWLEL
jgi:hypothetical protein